MVKRISAYDGCLGS